MFCSFNSLGNLDTHTEFGVRYFGREVKALEIHIPVSQILSLPPCTIEKLTAADILQKSYEQNTLLNEKEERWHYGNLHCVYNITSERGYMNVSITKPTLDIILMTCYPNPDFILNFIKGVSL